MWGQPACGECFRLKRTGQQGTCVSLTGTTMNCLGKPEINADLQLPLLTEVGMKQTGKYTVLIGKLPYGLQDICGNVGVE